MTHNRRRPAIGVAIYFTLTFVLGTYFTFASVQGDYGLFQRVQINAEAKGLRAELELLDAELSALENRTRRMSDKYLDLDLLDEQARDVLGVVRANEVVLR
ncbi:FtsB family cell division protein [Oceaniglobus ichthyenteri]|uniref:FtsB family cell division protein n=1 Tax=Oceaniglobus ichthyenteri TaxID=2136177 RepID=UPI000D3C9E35|nr:septum formation initiator family protein [Oceaniglobus ichthyenteri]